MCVEVVVKRWRWGDEEVDVCGGGGDEVDVCGGGGEEVDVGEGW